MALISSQSVARKLGAVRTALRHAFAVQAAQDEWTAEDDMRLDRVADAVVKRGMGAPAAVFLESLGPMNFLGSQAMHFMAPVLECAFSAKEITQVASLLERRDSISRLIVLIESKAAGVQGTPAR